MLVSSAYNIFLWVEILVKVCEKSVTLMHGFAVRHFEVVIGRFDFDFGRNDFDFGKLTNHISRRFLTSLPYLKPSCLSKVSVILFPLHKLRSIRITELILTSAKRLSSSIPLPH